jgi:type IV pilus assembly protein PilV
MLAEKIMFEQKPHPFMSAQQGVVLIEAMIAILIFSVGILGIVGMQAAMIKNTSNSKYRADAAYIAQQRIGLMWADPAGTAAGDYNKTYDVSDTLPGGVMTVNAPLVPTEFVIIIGWTAPGETPADAAAGPCFMTVAHCYITTAAIAGG